MAAVLRRGDQVLLCHRSPTRQWYPDVWDFAGGHVEVGERPRSALARELREELGVELVEVDPDPIIKVTDAPAGLELTVWVCTSWQGVVENLQSDEHDEIGWFKRQDLAGLAMADQSYLPVLERLLEPERR